MRNSGNASEKRGFFKKKANAQMPVQTSEEEQNGASGGVWAVLKKICRILYHLRKVVLAVPVIIAALRLAAYNAQNLPQLVGINLQSTGEFAHMISRQSAVMLPVMVTGGCLVLMLFSRKALYPWLISVFSLVLPILLLVTNLYPS